MGNNESKSTERNRDRAAGSPEKKQVLRHRSEEVKNLGGGRQERKERGEERREEGNEVSKPTKKRVKQVAAQ
jgi:hypothetical protein